MAASWTATAAPAIQANGFASNTATFSSVSIGTASSDRYVIVGIVNDSQSVSGITIGGVSATSAVATGHTAIYYLNVTAGTTATIVVTLAGAYNLIGIQVGILTGIDSTPTSTGVHPYDFVVDPQTVTATVPTGGVGVVIVNSASSASTPQIPSWSSAIADSYSHDETGNTIQAILAHTLTSGSQTPALTSSSATLYNFSGTEMAMACWTPSAAASTGRGVLRQARVGATARIAATARTAATARAVLT